MNEPMVRLDPRHYQDLVDEARLRVGQRCPQWTDHNVSDPGMTLIDQFAWMTDILLYRVNRIPDRVHEALLSLLGVQLEAPTAARAGLRFMLAQPPASPVEIGAGSRAPGPGVKARPPVEVATIPDDGQPAVVFEVMESATIPVLELAAAAVWRAERPEAQRLTTISVVEGRAHPGPAAAERLVFSSSPRTDDALYLGFDEPIAGLVVQLHVNAVPARGTSIDPDEPPLHWEVSRADGSWEPAGRQEPVTVLSDTTGGFNYERGVVELQIPVESARTRVGGDLRHWLRCRPAKVRPDAPDGARTFTRSPDVLEISANAIGVLARAHHARVIEQEELGVSDGTAGQTFRVLHAPTLALGDDETVEVEIRPVDRAPAARAGATRGVVRRESRWRRWELRDALDESTPADYHFAYDPASGEVRFGVAIKLRGYDEGSGQDAGWRQHGAIPPVGMRVRMTRYRHGGGEQGNVEAGTLTVLRTPIPGVASVTNPRPARGGLDRETLAAAQHRAAEQLRVRRRAVTRRDFEVVAFNASAQVARARCIAPEPDLRRYPGARLDARAQDRALTDRLRTGPGPAVQVCVLPHVDDPERFISPDDLHAGRELLELISRQLDEWCLVGTSVHVTPVAIRQVTVAAEVRCRLASQRVAVEARVVSALFGYLNPYVGGSLDGSGDGWEWGRALDVGELRTLVGRVDGVEDVLRLRVYETDLDPARGDGHPYRLIGERLDLGPHELLASGPHEARATPLGEL